MIRDLVVIVATVIFTVVVVVAGVLFFRLYRPLRTAARNLEYASNVILHGLVRPLNSLAALAELANRALAMFDDWRSRNRGSDDEQQQ